MGKREKNEKLTSDIVKIAWCLAAVIIVAAAVVFAVSHFSAGEERYTIEEYSGSVSINNKKIQAYKISDSGPYIVAEELPAVNLKADFPDKENIVISYSERSNVEKAKLTGKKAKLVSGEYYVNSEKKDTALGNYSDTENVISRMYTVNKVHLFSL